MGRLLRENFESEGDRYRRDLYRFAMSKVGKHDLAEELVQETFLAAWAGRKSFSGRSSVKTWLTGILKHKIVDHYRKHYRERDTRLVHTREEWDAIPETGRRTGAPEGADDPSDAAQKREFWSVLKRCVQDLPTTQARAFYLRELSGTDRKKILEALDVSPGNLNVILHRARVRLRASLQRSGFEDWAQGARCG
jgi:RNA polymerase sigma-70 factor (ECF subfamily)